MKVEGFQWFSQPAEEKICKAMAQEARAESLKPVEVASKLLSVALTKQKGPECVELKHVVLICFMSCWPYFLPRSRWTKAKMRET